MIFCHKSLKVYGDHKGDSILVISKKSRELTNKLESWYIQEYFYFFF